MNVANVSKLADRFEAGELVTKFHLALDLFDWDAIYPMLDDLVALVVGESDPQTDFLPKDTFTAELVARNAGYLLGNAGKFHGDYGRVVEAVGETATVICKFSAGHWLSGKTEDCASLMGRYVVTLIRRNEGWKIQRLWVRPIRWHGETRRVMSEAAANWRTHIAQRGSRPRKRSEKHGKRA
ncbi:nuclear transport factor 2 family protein [Caballeronia novacaledonica]|uniref:SnoaL-like domain-containing protein n=1 Tax=Caballeronia novacaledonica TaxID=1544861 RepID=A0AA37IM83_9BURK|nr:nuclear transport factor 2 family protein [Caballeronia novacaledonica]GJH29381.1 hypothetical protein CBA19CS42_32715 [Caballeronia novacaledonica]